MTTILDNINSPDVIAPVSKISADGEKESAGNSKFADVIGQASTNNNSESGSKSLEESDTNKETIAENTEQVQIGEVSSEALSKADNSVDIAVLLPNSQSKVALKEVKGYTPIQTQAKSHTDGVNIQSQVVINSQSGNKLPVEGQIQPVPPSQSLSNIAITQVQPEATVLQNSQIQRELESKVELTKIVNLNPVKASEKLTQTNSIPVETQAIVQAEIQKGPKQTIQPIDLGNLRIQNQSESSLVKVATDGSTPVNPVQTAPTLVSKNENMSINKYQGELQQFIDGEVKVKVNNPLSHLVKSDSVAETSTASNNQNSQTHTINPLSTTATQTAANSSEAKLTTMTMQTTYTAGNKEWSENFARNIALMTISKNNLAQIRMDPPDLGAIQVKISHTGSETNLQFQVNHNDTRQAIEASIQKLKEAMAEQGFTNVNVDIQHGEQSQNNEQQDNQSLANSETNGEENLLQQQTSLLQLGQLPSSGIDFFA